MAPGASFPGLAEPAKFGSEATRIAPLKKIIYRDDVGNNFRVLHGPACSANCRVTSLVSLRMKGLRTSYRAA